MNSVSVQLRYAGLPYIGLLAGGRSIGNVHCDLKLPDAGVGGGPARDRLQVPFLGGG